ncbi:MAG: hypothetical protein OXT09_15390, partial [Myxococcales bacterium]|nr:hypothetical protein [Myxococcales bacterium]
FLRISANFLRARALLARMAADSDRHSEALIAPHVKVLRKAKRPDADCLADLLDAGVHNLRGRKEHAQRLLERCVGGVDEHQMPAFARYAELGLAALNADRERRQRVASALAEDGVSDPDRWVSMFAPGLLEIPERRMRVA